ncbi:inner membrane-spanning protein YciB [Altererythrobacter lutimaris]|uniref:Inner membrane-spanning protein YciB n=1 Tax=Altererythrobacter lutimaris TaxID=2743979 RepID=A0A850H5A8_9SPHN|nr:inner membrane-spanning protein YciB [Altererythrobacter lutimaris]NVE94394.1 septation protein IspZ [Altererythrobacter lutimaris]
MSDVETPAAKPKSSWQNLLVDYGPLVIFIGVYKWSAPAESDPAGEIAAVINGTLAFMVAAVIALLVSKWKFGSVSPMLIFSTVLIVGFGALTIFFGDPLFIQVKPTIIYSILGAALLIGVWRGKSFLQILLQQAFEGVDEQGWLKLSRNWGLFFFFLAGVNEVLRYLYNFENGKFETYLWADFWVILPLTFLFTFSQIPMLLKHGFSLDGGEDEDEPEEQAPPPPPQS